MKKFFAFLTLALLAFSIACNNDDDDKEVGELSITFEAYYGDDPLYMYNGVDGTFDYEDNTAILFQLFQFYISELSFLNGSTIDSEGTLIKDVELVSFKDVLSETEGAEGITFIYNEAPVGVYNGLRFGLGVSSDLNAKGPEDFDATHPLSGHYWGPSAGYVFFKIEGNGDVDGSDSFEEKLTYHVGGNELYAQLGFLNELEIVKDESTALTIRVDVKDILIDSETGEFLDIKNNPIDHTTNADVYEFLTQNMLKAFSIRE